AGPAIDDFLGRRAQGDHVFSSGMAADDHHAPDPIPDEVLEDVPYEGLEGVDRDAHGPRIGAGRRADPVGNGRRDEGARPTGDLIEDVQRGWELTHLLSVTPEDSDSMLFHVPNLSMTALLAQAMRRPLLTEVAKAGEVGELDALRRIFRRIDVDEVVVGAIASDYQHDRVNRIAEEVGLRIFAPLWRHDPHRLLRDYLASGFEIVFSSVSAEGLDASSLGRRWDERTIEDLLRLEGSRGIHPCGEGGEYETLVLDAPL